MGIEPTCSAWKADILPLNYTRTAFQQIILYHNLLQKSIAKYKKSRNAQKEKSATVNKGQIDGAEKLVPFTMPSAAFYV